MKKIKALYRFLSKKSFKEELDFLNQIVKSAQVSNKYKTIVLDELALPAAHPMHDSLSTFEEIFSYYYPDQEAVENFYFSLQQLNKDSQYIDIQSAEDPDGNESRKAYRISAIKPEDGNIPVLKLPILLTSDFSNLNIPETANEQKTQSETKENTENEQPNGSYYFPVLEREITTVTSRVGVDRGGTPHGGEDIAPQAGKEAQNFNIVPIANGYVVNVVEGSRTGGNYVFVLHDERPEDGSRMWSGYFHMNLTSVQLGDRVLGGQTVIGTMGNTGSVRSSNPSLSENLRGKHLHLELWKMDKTTAESLSTFEAAGGTNVLDFGDAKPGTWQSDWDVSTFQ